MSAPRAWTALGTEQHVIRAEPIGTSFRVGVAQPIGPGGASAELAARDRLPVIYVVDADGHFGLAVDTVRCLQIGELLPAALVVGIGYADAAVISDWVELRKSDLTPTAWTNPRAGIRGLGGAQRFLDFIRDTVKPFVEARYPADPDDATLIGDSLGGLFALHVLFHEPQTFQRYVIGSPASAWDDGVIFRSADEYARQHSDLSARVFLSAGALEAAEMLSNMERMAAHLRAQRYASLSLATKVFDDETHSSVIPGTFSRGLRSVFGAD